MPRCVLKYPKAHGNTPLIAWYLHGTGPICAATVAMAIVLVARHHANIRKLVRGEESRVGSKRKAPEAGP